MPDALQVCVTTFTLPTTIGAGSDLSIAITDQDGTGFDPKIIFLFINEQTVFDSFGSHAIMAHGMATATTEQFAACTSIKDAVSVVMVTKRRQTASACLIVVDEDGNLDVVASLFEAFGTTANTVKLDVTTGTTAYVGHLVALGGSAITAAKVTTFVPATVAAVTVDVTGFTGTPNLVFFMAAGQTAHDTTEGNASLMFGWHGPDVGAGNNNGHSLGLIAQDGVATTNTGSMVHKNYQVIESIKSGVPAAAADFFVSAYASGQFTAQTATIRAAAYIVGCAALTIEGVKTSLHAAPTAVGTQDGPSLSFTPRGVFFLTNSLGAKTILEAPHDDALYGIGFTNQLAEGAIWAGNDDGDTTSEADSISKNTKALVMAGYGSPTVHKEADCTVMAATWTLDFTTADATARDYAALTLGETTIAGARRIMVILT